MSKNYSEWYKGNSSDGFPYRLRQCLEGKVGNKLRLSKEEFIQKVGIKTESVLRNHLSGLNGMKVPELMKTADLYNVTVGYLVGHEKTPLNDPDIREIAKYTGLSEKSIQMLHRFKHGRKVTVTDYVFPSSDGDVTDGPIEISKTITLLPNERAIEAINILLQTDYDYLAGEHFEPQDDGCCEWSIFDEVYTLIFPQKAEGDNPDYSVYVAEKSLRKELYTIRDAYNEEYGAHGENYQKSLEERERAQRKEMLLNLGKNKEEHNDEGC